MTGETLLACAVLALSITYFRMLALVHALSWKLAFLVKRVGELERRIYGCAMPDLTEERHNAR